MRHIPKIAFLILLIPLLVSCGGGKKDVQDANKTGLDIPDWFISPPEDTKDYMYSTGTATSKLMNVSIERAKSGANGAIASKIDTKVERVKKDFLESTGLLEEEEILGQFTIVQKEITSQKLTGVEVVEQEFAKDDKGLITTYVLVRYPVGAAAQRFLEGISKQDRLYTEFKASKAFEELEDDIKRYQEERGY